MRSMPRVYTSFEDFERDELKRMNQELSIDEMLDELFSDELDVDFKSKSKANQTINPSPIRKAS